MNLSPNYLNRRLSEEDRFRLGYKKARSGCWEWQGGLSTRGYGVITVMYRQIRAHRYSYEKFVGNIPEGRFVCHRCDNPRCVNPKHLWLGTHKDNMRDMRIKARSASGNRQHLAKMTPAKVRKIRSIVGMKQRDIAKLFNVSQTAVGHIIRRITWRHVE